MYPWNVLETVETTDKKSVKKAYAKLLRQYRPDEQPEAFQEINQAYQYALQLIKNQANQPVNEENAVSLNSDHATNSTATHHPSTEQAELTKESLGSDQQEGYQKNSIETGNSVEIEELELRLSGEEPDALMPLGSKLDDQNVQDDIELSGETDVHDDQIEQQIDEMFKQVHEMAFSSVRQRSETGNWSFLEFYHEIHDIYLRDQVAKEMFKRVAEYNLFQLKENKLKLIPINVIVYMNELFEWEANWQEYMDIFPDHYFKVNFEDIEKKEDSVGAKYKPSIFTRCSALFVDFIAYFLLVGMLATVANLDSFKESWLLLVGFSVFRLLTELFSKNRNSVGVMYLGYRFLDHYLNLPDRKTVIKRYLCFELSLSPLYLMPFLIALLGGETTMIILSLYVVALFIFIYIRKGQFPHDFLSDTVAVKKL